MTMVEPLEPRSLLAMIGLDASFGVRGVASPLTDFSEQIESVGATDDGLIIQVRNVNVLSIAKLRSNGSVDSAWGVAGRIPSPYGESAVRPVFDPWRKNVLLVAEQGSAVRVTKVLQDGSVDTTFGTDGAFTFALGAGNMVLQAVTPLPRGAILVTFTTEVEVGQQTFRDVQVMKLNGFGQRDTSFGRRGVKTLISSISSSTYDVGSGDVREQTTTFDVRDVQPVADGGFRFLTIARSTSRDDQANGAKSRTYDAHVFDIGADGGTRAGTFTSRLLRSSWDDSSGARSDLFVVAGAALTEEGASVIGNSLRTPVQRLDLRPKGRPSSTPTSLDARQTLENSLVKVPRGGFFAFAGDSVRKLRVDLSPDRRWGDAGTCSVSNSSGLGTVDLAGAPIVFADSLRTKLARLDGSLPQRNSTPSSARLINTDQLSVVGTSAADRVAVINRGERIEVRINNTYKQLFSRWDIASVIIETGAGDDTVVTTFEKSTTVSLGTGNDLLDVSGMTSVFVNGGKGFDTIRSLFGVDASLLTGVEQTEVTP